VIVETHPLKINNLKIASTGSAQMEGLVQHCPKQEPSRNWVAGVRWGRDIVEFDGWFLLEMADEFHLTFKQSWCY
jgi:hypothetical protein